ncbi:aminoglycoside phosphotransferase family protein [Skermanella stibiiresistens]|uniref:aminoglycoside phosphotransferase family protein n=1 Tax=Skermanella stibiiresistens TaxID=913326 RepID=UPI001FE221BE|nr:aminoglycoside phosphotransferase family protein [Skermanella stibiiresistens]
MSDSHLAAALRARLDLAAEPVALPPKGMAHAHFRLPEGGLARVPRWSQIGLDAASNLRHQAKAFTRAAPSGHTPQLLGLLEPGDGLPMGALMVEEITGRPPRLPGDMPAIARALAAIHLLPAEPAGNPIAATVKVIERQAPYFAKAGLAPATLAHLEGELDWVHTLPTTPEPPVTLVGTDTHPGNFLIDANGKAWFVDLEKATDGLPAIDLAHASLYTSTTWDPDVAAVLDANATAALYDIWSEAVTPELAEAVRPWFAVSRRLVWLRTLSWMARWKVEGAVAHGAGVDPRTLAHVRDRIEDFFTPATIARVRESL